MKRENPGVRITIDGTCNIGKTVMAQGFAELLARMGVPAENITMLNDSSPDARPTGGLAYELMKQLAESPKWADTKFVFVERMVPLGGVIAVPDVRVAPKWNAMPDLSQQPNPTSPCFLLPHSQVQFEMTNKTKPSEAAEALMELFRVVRDVPKSVETGMLDMVMIHPEEYQMLVRLNELVKIRLRRDVLLTKPTVEQRIEAMHALTEDLTGQALTTDASDEDRSQRSLRTMLAFASLMADVKNSSGKPFDPNNPITPDLMKLSGLFRDDGTLNVYEFARQQEENRAARKQRMMDQAQDRPPVSRLQEPTAFWDTSKVAQVLKSPEPQLAFFEAMKNAGHGALWDEHRISICLVDRKQNGDWYDESRARHNPDNVYQCWAEARISRNDGESVKVEDRIAMEKACREFDPTIIVSSKFKNSNISGAHIPEIKGVHLKDSSSTKRGRGQNPYMWHIDDAGWYDPNKQAVDYTLQVHPITGETLSEMVDRVNPLIKRVNLGGHMALDYSNLPADLVFDPKCGVRWKTEWEMAHTQAAVDQIFKAAQQGTLQVVRDGAGDIVKAFVPSVVPLAPPIDPQFESDMRRITRTPLYQEDLTRHLTEACRTAVATAGDLKDLFADAPPISKGLQSEQSTSRSNTTAISIRMSDNTELVAHIERDHPKFDELLRGMRASGYVITSTKHMEDGVERHRARQGVQAVNAAPVTPEEGPVLGVKAHDGTQAGTNLFKVHDGGTNGSTYLPPVVE